MLVAARFVANVLGLARQISSLLVDTQVSTLTALDSTFAGRSEPKQRAAAATREHASTFPRLLMRTAIYVTQPTTVRINTTDPRDVGALLLTFVAPGPSSAPDPVPAPGTHSLDRGIYAVHTLSTVSVTGEHVTTETRAADKDGWPDPPPPPPVIELVPSSTAASIITFLTSIAKQVDD